MLFFARINLTTPSRKFKNNVFQMGFPKPERARVLDLRSKSERNIYIADNNFPQI